MADDDTDGGDAAGPAPDSLLPYDSWTEDALRQVAGRALAHAAENGLPGDHHFYVTFRTDAPGVVVPPRLLAQYPQEMTVVLQHQFWDLAVADDVVTVGLSFGGVPSKLRIPLTALTGFADPHVRYGLRFRVPEPPPSATVTALPGPATSGATPPPDQPMPDATPQVVSLDAFRRKAPPKEGG